MNFERFAEIHGLIISGLILDRWVRVPTTDHPHKKNGAYFFDGRTGAVQNWATHEKPVPWKSDTVEKVDDAWKEKKRKAEEQRAVRQGKASKKAGWIMHNCKTEMHPYLTRKGFDDIKGYVWNNLFVIPMRVGTDLVGCQLIDAMGNKKFLSGQITKGASAIFDAKGMDIVCEGYATALSIRRVMKKLGKRYKIHVAFSAGNIPEIAKGLDCIIVADHDPMGIKMAKSTGKPYWVSPMDKEDFNDAEMRLGTDALAVLFSEFLVQGKPKVSVLDWMRLPKA
jgi:putative DNA primase/helicase